MLCLRDLVLLYPRTSLAQSSISDDAEENAFGGIYLGSSDLELVYDGSNQTVGMRFTGVSVPNGATITNAYVQFQVDEVNSGATSLSIQGEASDNALTFTRTTANISSRPRTSAAVAWAPSPWSTVGARGPDHVQTVISTDD